VLVVLVVQVLALHLALLGASVLHHLLDRSLHLVVEDLAALHLLPISPELGNHQPVTLVSAWEVVPLQTSQGGKCVRRGLAAHKSIVLAGALLN